MKQSNEIKFNLLKNAVPEVIINGENVPVVSCVYQYMTSNTIDGGANMFVASVLVGPSFDQKTVYHNSLTNETYLQ